MTKRVVGGRAAARAGPRAARRHAALGGGRRPRPHERLQHAARRARGRHADQGDRLALAQRAARGRRARPPRGHRVRASCCPSCGLGEACEVLDRVRAATPRGQTASAGVARWDGEEPAELLVARAAGRARGGEGRRAQRHDRGRLSAASAARTAASDASSAGRPSSATARRPRSRTSGGRGPARGRRVTRTATTRPGGSSGSATISRRPVHGDRDVCGEDRQRAARVLAQAAQRLAPAPEREEDGVVAVAHDRRDRDRVRAVARRREDRDGPRRPVGKRHGSGLPAAARQLALEQRVGLSRAARPSPSPTDGAPVVAVDAAR